MGGVCVEGGCPGRSTAVWVNQPDDLTFGCIQTQPYITPLNHGHHVVAWQAQDL